MIENVETGLGKSMIALEDIDEGIMVNYLGMCARDGEFARGISAYNVSIGEQFIIYTNNEALLLAGDDFDLNDKGFKELTCDSFGRGVPANIGEYVNAIALSNGFFNNFVKVEVVSIPYLKK